MTPADLLRLYDDEVRGSFAHRLPAGWVGESDGPLTRCVTSRDGFAMLTAPADGLSTRELEQLVDRTVQHFAALGRSFEWKTFDHDRADLRPLLLDRGAVAEDREALVLGEARLLAGDPVLPDGIALREVADRHDLERIARMETEVWGEDWSWLADDLAERLTGEDPIHVFVAEDTTAGAPLEDGEAAVVSAAWLVPLPGTRVAGMWGGSTLEAYRGRGIYRALVAVRARLALDLGHPFVQVDASDDSRPILQRLGLHVVGGTQPFVFGR